MTPTRVRRFADPLSEVDARELLASVIDALCSDPEIGTGIVARTLSVDASTVRSARNMRSTLGLHNAANLLLLDPTALNPILREYGLVAVPIDGEPEEEDQTFGEIAEAANEVVGLFVRARLSGARLCHRSKAAILKASDKLAGVRAKLGRRS